MKFDNDNNVLTLYLSGRIDANNSADIESEITQVLAENPGLVPVFDASELEYISSAGLRVLLKFRKQFGKAIDVINASSDVYDIFEVTGFTELLNVKKKLREVSIEGCEVIGGGFYSTVYRLDKDTIVKVFNRAAITLDKIEKDQKIAREVFVMDIPTAISYDVVRVGEHYGIVYEMVDADTIAGTVKKHPERLSELGRKEGILLKKLHTTEFPAGALPDALTKWRNAIDTLHEHEFISASDADMLHDLINGIPARHTLIHYDYHPKNILVQDDELILIDVGEASLGHPVIDFSSMYLSAFLPVRRLGVPSEYMENIIGLNQDELSTLWREMLGAYLKAEIPGWFDDAIEGYTMIRMLHSMAERLDQSTAQKTVNFCVSSLKAKGLRAMDIL